MTRGEIEEIRGVAVSTNIVRSLLEREWIRVVGHRDVPGRPAMFGTTKIFLDYFSLKKLEDLPPLADLSDWESLRVQLNLPAVDEDEMPETDVDTAEIPVLYAEERPEEEVDETEPDAEALAAAEALVDAGFEGIVATDWPDPLAVTDDSAGQVNTEVPGDETDDAEASVRGT